MKRPQQAVLSLALLLSACSCASDEPRSLGPGSDAALGQKLAFDQQHQLLSELLGQYVTPGGVRYADLSKDTDKLNRYLAMVQSITPVELETWTRNQRYAFWINTYNAHILALIVDNYPLDSIRDLGGAVFGKVWDLELIPMGAHNPDGSGDSLSLGDIGTRESTRLSTAPRRVARPYWPKLLSRTSLRPSFRERWRPSCKIQVATASTQLREHSNSLVSSTGLRKTSS
jgi:hypothetical protein